MARAVCVVFAACVLAQPPRDAPHLQPATTTASGVIRGRVVSAATGDPIVNAEITIAGMPDRPRPDDAPETVLSDASGRYELPAVSGQLTVEAKKAGFSFSFYGSRRAGDPPRTIAVPDGAIVDGVDIVMRKAAAISGRIVDEFGDPVVGGQVVASG